MGAPQYEQAGADIGGTGTTNTIPRWTGPSTLGDSAITDDGSVIRASRQTWILNVNGLRVSDGGTTNFARLSQSGANSILDGLAPSGQVWIRTNAGATLAIAATDTGNVGIGTASPGARLHVTQGASGSFANLLIGSAGTSTNFYDANEHYWRNGTLATGMYMNASGNVGIGTASPASRLDVAGTITCDDAGTGLKLPATPGNADTQTLDCYQENTWTPTLTGFGGTAPTVDTARFTRVGRLVYFAIRLSATGGANYSGTRTTTYISLPVAPGYAQANALMADNNVNSLGQGLIATNFGGVVFLPTFALTVTGTCISGVYEV